MNRLIILVLISLLCLDEIKAQGQDPAITIVPSSNEISTVDSFNIKVKLTWNHYDPAMWDSVKIIGDTVIINICAQASPQLALMISHYDYNIGPLDSGKYIIKVIAYEAEYADSSKYRVSNTAVQSFHVHEFVNPELSFSSVSKELSTADTLKTDISSRWLHNDVPEWDSLIRAGDTIYFKAGCLASAKSILKVINYHYTIGTLDTGTYYLKAMSFEKGPTDTSRYIYQNSIIEQIHVHMDSESTVITNILPFRIQVSIAPNPTRKNQAIIIQGEGLSEDCSVELFDVSGRQIKNIYQGRLLQGNNVIFSDLSGLKQGIYFYEVRTDGNAKHFKIVKE
jgi:hypothetical protein